MKLNGIEAFCVIHMNICEFNRIVSSVFCILFRVTGGLEPIPACIWRGAGNTLDRSPVLSRCKPGRAAVLNYVAGYYKLN